MKNRTKMISLLMALCMMITLLPAVAFAAGKVSSVKIGGVELNNTNKWYVNGTDGAPGTAHATEPTVWNARFENGTLTLNNLNIVNVKKSGSYDDVRGIWWSTNDLEIVLTGENIVTNTRGAALVAGKGLGSTGPSLTITGNGTLYATGSTSGMWIWKDITIGGNAKVYATGVTKYGIANNTNSGTITINGNAEVIADGARADSTESGKKYGIGCENGGNPIIKVESGRLTAFGADGAIQKGFDNCYESTVTVADNVKGENTQEISSGSISDTHKYVAVGNALTLPKYYVFFDRNVNPDNPDPNAPAMAAQSVTSGSLQLANYDANKYWATKDNGSGTSYANQATLTPIRSMILYARDGSITTFSVSFNAGEGGTGTMAAVEGISGKYILPFNGFTAPTGKKFYKWRVVGDSTRLYTPGETITVSEDVTVQAVWKDLDTFSVWFYPGAPQGDFSGSMTPQTFTEGVAQALTPNAFTRDGYTFNGWNTEADGSGTSYADGASVTLTDSGLTLFAQWTQNSTPATYTVTYDANGGSGTMVAGSVSSSSGHYVFPANGFTAPDGKQFKCWNMGGTNYNVGDAINVTSDITVKAVWEDIPTGGGTTPTPTPDNSNPGTINPTPTPVVPTVDASNGISLWYNGGNSFGSSKSAVPTSVEIDGVPVVFNGTGSEFTVGCISPNAKWVTVNWNTTSVTTNFTPDANATCAEISLPKTGDVSVMAFALMAVIAAAGAMGKK